MSMQQMVKEAIADGKTFEQLMVETFGNRWDETVSVKVQNRWFDEYNHYGELLISNTTQDETSHLPEFILNDNTLEMVKLDDIESDEDLLKFFKKYRTIICHNIYYYEQLKLYHCNATYFKTINGIWLKSYKTLVAYYSFTTNILYSLGKYSATTSQHIRKFEQILYTENLGFIYETHTRKMVELENWYI